MDYDNQEAEKFVLETITDLEETLEDLNWDLKDILEEENYEEAAVIMDRIDYHIKSTADLLPVFIFEIEYEKCVEDLRALNKSIHLKIMNE